MKNIIIPLFVIFFFTNSDSYILVAQQTVSFQEIGNRKKNFDEFMTAVDSFYRAGDILNKGPMRSEYIKWQRWGWYTGSHLDEHDLPVNMSDKIWNTYRNFLEEDLERMDAIRGDNRSNTGAWTPIGPYWVTQGLARVDRLAFHPTNQSIFYAGTPAGGLYKTSDGAATWFPLNGFLPNVGVSGIVVDQVNPDIIYVLTGDGDSDLSGGFVKNFGYIRAGIGLLKSEDGGTTWSKISSIVGPGETYFGFKLIQLSALPYRFFACTSRGLYRSNDYGITWVRDANIGDQNVFDVEDAGNGYVYASTTNQVFVSSNFGNPFTQVPTNAFSQPPTGFTQRTSIMISPASPNSLYVHFGGMFSNGEEKLLYRSDNNGSTFTLVNANAPRTQKYMAGMTALRTDFNTVLIGEITLNRSSNGGTDFSVVGDGVVHADVHEIQCHPLSSNIYVACDGGVYVSLDNGLTWDIRFNGIQASQFYHLTGVNGDNNLILGGAQDNGNIQTDNNGATYRREQGGDGFESAYLNEDNNKYYITTNEFVQKGQRSPYMLIDKTPAGSSGFYPTLAIHPSSDVIIYAGYQNGVYRSDNDGVDWSNKGAAGSSGGSPAGGLAVSGQQPDRIYAANNQTIWISNNKGDNWSVISTNPGFPSITTATPITDIVTRSNNADEIWVTLGGFSMGNKVFYSNNGGATWFNFSGTLPNIPVHSIKYTGEGDAYIGTDVGVYFMDYAMTDWVPFSNGLPLVPVADLFINEINGTIKAATFGRGIWQGDLFSDCGPFMLLSGNAWGRNFYQSGGFIETSQNMAGSIGNELRLRSPQRIVFKNGFRAYNNSYVRAIIGPCGQGVFNMTGSSEKEISKLDFLQLEVDYKGN